jgi:hypothetical protein
MPSRVPNNRKPTITPLRPSYAGARDMTRRQRYDHIQAFQRTAPSTGGGQGTVVPVPSIGAGTAAAGSGGGGSSSGGGSGGVTLSDFVPATLGVGQAPSAGTANTALRSDAVYGLPGTFVQAGASAAAGFVPAPGGSASTPYMILGDNGSWNAQTSITKLGTIVAGVWNGTVIGATYLPTATSSALGLVQPDGTIITVSAGVITVPKASATTFGVCEVDNVTITASGGVLTAVGGASTSATPFAAYAGGTAYTSGQVVKGSDSNLYIAQTSTTGNSPIGDTGTNWRLWALNANLSLTCGPGGTFADTFAASGSPGGAMTPGMINALAFVATAIGAAAPSVAALTITQGLNSASTFSASANGSTTTIKTTTNVPIGAQILGLTGHNVGTVNTVTTSSFSGGTYTLGVTAMTSTVSGDTYQFAPYYGTNGITVKLPVLGPNLTILGSASTVPASGVYPSLTTTTGGAGSLPGGTTYSCAITYTWTDASGTTRETMAGAVEAITTGGNSSNVIWAGFTLPTGATGANAYASNSGSTLFKQGSFSVSGGVASAFTMSSYASSTAAATVNPNAATWPCAMQWGSTTVFNIGVTNGLTINGLLLWGGANCLSIAYCQGLTLGPALVVTNATNGANINSGSTVAASGVQIDTCTRNFFTQSRATLVANNTTSMRPTNYCYLAQGNSFMQVSPAFGGYQSGATAAFACFGESNINTTPTDANSKYTYGSTNASSPAINTNTTNNYINTAGT